MQLSTATIKHKRYSTYGWTVVENDKYKNTLAQGEIGILLGHEYFDEAGNYIVESITEAGTGKPLNCVLEIRIGTQDNQHFFDALIISNKDNIDHSIKQCATFQLLPAFGNVNLLYIVTSTNTIYRWDDVAYWVPVMSGSSTDPCGCDLSNYYTKQQIDNLFQQWVDEILNIEMIDGGDCRGQSSVHI